MRIKDIVIKLKNKNLKSKYYVGLEDIVGWAGTANYKHIEMESDYPDTFQFVEKDSICFSKLRPYLAKGFIAQKDIIATTELFNFKVKSNVNKKFFLYYILNKNFIEKINNSVYGIGMPRLNWNLFCNFKIEKFCSLNNQNKIVSFLDDKCSKIDKEIDLLEKKSILLDEYKNALIYETVTKGLDKNAEMKDSGIEWIGDIPKHWEIKRIKDIASLEKGKANEMFTFEEKENYYLPCIDTNFLRGRENHIMYNKNGRLTQSGDVLILWDGANAGELFINPEKGYLGSTFGKFIHKKNVNNMFLFYYLKGIEKYFRSNLVGMGIPHVNSTKLKTSIFIYPSYNEQINIVKFLDFETKKIENQIELINKKIELLKEYKQSLIYEAVTGQLDIE